MTPSDIYAFFAALAKANPTPRSDLHYTNAYTLLVAVVLSAQATDKGVNKATPALFAIADTPAKMLALGEDNLRDYIKTINYYPTKARNIIAAAQMLVERHKGQVPNTRESLMALAGVGRKSANVILNVAFGQPVIAVDTHIFRVANRTGLVSTKTPEKTESALEKIIPQEFLDNAHHWLVLHGRYICKAKKPLCPTCPVRNLCTYGDKTS